MPSSPALARALVGALLATPLVACAWSVPADPGRNVRERGHVDATVASAPAARARATAPIAAGDDGTRALYERKCGQCHAPFSPRHATPAQWPGLVRNYGPRAGLFGEERARVTRWLQAAAR
jgi:cytochrome c5